MRRGESEHPPAGKPLSMQWVIGIVAITALFLVAIGGIMLLDTQGDAWGRSEQGASNLAIALSRDVDREIGSYDRALQSIAATYARPVAERNGPDTRQIAFFREFYGGSLDILNGNGERVAGSDTTPAPGVSPAEQIWFTAHRDHSDGGLFVSRAILKALPDRSPAVVLSRRLSRVDGSFAGVVATTVPVPVLQAMFDKLDLGPSGSAELLRADGRVIARFPFFEQDIDRDLGETPAFQRFNAAEAGVLVATSALDGMERLYTFRHVAGLPLIVAIGIGTQDIYNAWWHRAAAIGGILILLCGSTVILCVTLGRENTRRLEAEVSLRGATVQLAMTAATDGLTGLSNRKSFEDRLEREWQRAIRAGTTMALLIIDADYFKEYNDRFGHAEGDQVLRAIAGCIGSNVLRPGDINARFSGAAFAVVLPETDSLGAAIVAERIRAAVANLTFTHLGSQPARVTVSIGIAVSSPAKGGDTQRAMLARAEDGLREAKRTGRNRIGTVEPEHAPTATTFGTAARRPR